MGKVNKVFASWKRDGLRGVIRSILLYLLGLISPTTQSVNSKPVNDLAIVDAQLLQRNKALKNMHEGRRCFVIGAGPSLKNLDLKLLANEYYIGVNAVYLNTQLPDTNKGFWCTIDTFVKPFINILDYSIPWLRALENSTSKEMTYFFPVEAQVFCQKHGLFIGRQVYYLGFGDAIGVAAPDPSYVTDRLDVSIPLIFPHNVIETAITCAAYMGFRKIYLLGCDSDWFLYDNLNIKHFYSHDPKGFIETRKDDGSKEGYFVMDTREKKLYYSFLLYRNYRLLKEALEVQGVQIFNASGGGKLDVFPCVQYETLFPDR